MDIAEFYFHDQTRPSGISAGQESLADFIISGNFEDLEKYFWERTEGSQGYPFVHGKGTYGAFQDFQVERERAYSLITAMARLVESVPDAYFHMALALLERLIPKDSIGPRPPGFSDSLLRMRLRAEKLSFLPNLVCTWNGLMVTQRSLKSNDDPLSQYSANELSLNRGEWPGLSVPLQEFVDRPLEHCQADFGELRRAIQQLGGSPGARQLIFSTRVKKTFYWVWQLPGEEGTAHLQRLVFLRQPVEGDCELGYWDIYRQFHERPTSVCISQRLLKIEFSVNSLIKIPRNIPVDQVAR